MTPSLILSAAFSPAARIGGGGSAPTTHAPAVNSFARSGKSVASTVSGYIAAGLPQGSVARVHGLSGVAAARQSNKFGAVAGSSCQSADAILQDGFVLVNPRTPGALTECATFETSAGGHIA